MSSVTIWVGVKIWLCGVQVFDTFVDVLEKVIILECRFQIVADVDSPIRPLGLVSVDDDVCARS